MEEHGEVYEAFRLVPAIKAIVQCRSISALKALENVIDDRLNELDGIEQNTGFTEQTGVETGQTGVKTEQEPSKIERKKKTKKSYDQAVYPEDQVMGRYGTTTVYKPVVDVILEKTADRFNRLDVAKIIDKHYNFTLERSITAGSARSYASFYIKCMRSKGLIKEDGAIGYHMMLKKCTAVQKDSSISEEKEEGDSGEKEGLKEQINENRQFLNEVCS